MASNRSVPPMLVGMMYVCTAGVMMARYKVAIKADN